MSNAAALNKIINELDISKKNQTSFDCFSQQNRLERESSNVHDVDSAATVITTAVDDRVYFSNQSPDRRSYSHHDTRFPIHHRRET
jgi:hypothetical protein